MKVGTKSLLFGVHQFLFHPTTVFLAWTNLYGLPTWKECICIFVHDWGYWNSPNMDGEEGERHPETGAKIAGRLLGQEYYDLCLLHSRHYARQLNREPSKLCWADKLSTLYDPAWWYLFRAHLSGEINEYRQLAVKFVPLSASDREWIAWIKDKFYKLAAEQRGDAVPYINPERK